MKLKFQCRKCFREFVTTYNSIQIQENDLYEFYCTENHRNIYFVNNEKFELLMESAVFAIKDGYYREAISAMAASLERLQEFAITIIIKKNNVDDNLFKTGWNSIRKHSERQLGAFTFLYLQEFGKFPDLLTDTERGFRNNVIHNGNFPNYEQTIDFGQRVLDITYNVLLQLRESAENTIREFAREESEVKLKMIEDLGESPFTYQMKNIINLHWHISSFEKANLKEYLKNDDNAGFRNSI